MKFKSTKSVFISLFLIYWVIVIVMQTNTFSKLERVQNSLIGYFIFPPTYTMYTSPPKQIVKSYYTFYKNNKPILKVDVDSLFHHRIKENFPDLSVKKNIKLYMMLYYKPNVDMSNGLYNYTLDTLKNKTQSIQNYLEYDSLYLKQIQNQMNFAEILKNNINIIRNSDSALLEIKRKYNMVEIDPYSRKKFAYFIKDSVLVVKNIKF